ncbi:cytochrome c oxidase subunit 6b-1-like isoform X2 [Diospyros lotus]|uniref:cytochrome c oxidase subunit 6b-1-like isoform X2 n=1 Tax=Diospyros lotus TaxID=55363 RepID=UPI00225948AF|nr:cytochrome c oxidase subunit 6b-1-like isoform X2 [Diospyros lotus]
MAEVHTAKTPSLSEQYLLKEKEEKLDSGLQPAEELEVKIDASATTEEVVTPKTEENSVTVGSDEGENSVAEDTQVAAEESTVSAEQEDSGDQEVEETPEVKLETAPADFRFPTTNQTRHCFTRYIEYHRCVAAKGEGAPECDKFAKYYRSLCPGEWIDRWNEQRENGTFPGPL